MLQTNKPRQNKKWSLCASHVIVSVRATDAVMCVMNAVSFDLLFMIVIYLIVLKLSHCMSTIKNTVWQHITVV